MNRFAEFLLRRLRGSTRRAVEEAIADYEVEKRRARSTRARPIGRASGVVAVMRALGASIVAFDSPFREGFMDRLVTDVRYAWRRLRRTPGFTLVAVLTLALGIGANTALFSLVNGLLFKSIPIPHLDRMVLLTEVDRSSGRVYASLSDDERRALAGASAASLDEFVMADPLIGAVTTPDGADVVQGELVTGNYFRAMGVSPRAGRLLEPTDDRENGTDTPIVISERLWRRRFGASPAAIGAAVKMADHPLVIVGVAPESFAGTWLPTILTEDVWVPLRAQKQVKTVQGIGDGAAHRTFGTLRPGVSLPQVDALTDTIGHQFPLRPNTHLAALPARDGIMNPEFNHYGALLGSAVLALSGLVFLIACANLANLLLARGNARVGEIAVRIASGAGRGRILQLVLTETGLLTLLAGLAGIVMTFVTTRLMTTIPLPVLDGINLHFDPTPDLRVFGFAFAVAVLASLAVGLAPAIRASRVEPLQILTSGGASGGATSRGHRVRTLLVGTQIAMSTVVLTSAGLYLHSALKAMDYQPGFDVSAQTIASVDVRYNKLDQTEARAAYRRMLAAAEQLPGVKRAALASAIPGALGSPVGTFVLPEGREAPRGADGFFSWYSDVSPGFFDVIQLPLQKGRDFNESDVKASMPVAIISEFGAAKFWPGQDPIGKRLRLRGTGPLVEIVGVSANTRGGFADDVPRPFVFLPLEQDYAYSVGLVVRSSSNPATMVDPLRAAMNRANPSLPLVSAYTLASYVGLILAPIRITALVLGSLGALGFGIAILGIHGVMAFVVSQRTREFGIRRALGATSLQVHRVVLTQGLRMLLCGVAPGFVAAVIGAGFLRHLLYGIDARDPATFILVPLSLIVAGLAASVTSARRAARIYPNVALRNL